MILIGTYWDGQLKKWKGYYNYPISDADKVEPEKINELWLFNGNKKQRTFTAKFVGIKTRKELVSEYKYPAKGSGHGDKYLLYKIKRRLQPSRRVDRAFIRLKDFAKRSPKVVARLKQFLESTPEGREAFLRVRTSAALVKSNLPRIVTSLPKDKLIVGEAALQMDFLDMFFPRAAHVLPSVATAAGHYNVISLFSGAMGLDNGIEKAGMDIRLCVEFQHAMAETIRANKPDIPLIEDDVRNYSGTDLLKRAGLKRGDEVFLVCGGPPCQAFSTAGKRLGFDDDRGNVFLKYLDIIGEIRPKYFLLENVRGLLSASYVPPGSDRKPEKGTALLFALEKIKSMGYSATFTLYDSANYGVPQKRERVIILGSRDGYKIPLIPPTHSETGKHGLKKWRTFRSAIAGLKKCTAAPIPKKRLPYFKMLGPGQYWKNLPQSVQEDAMGKSYLLPGGKTGFYRRLAWDEPAPTLVTCPTMPATDLMHPTEDRALSIEEYARIQMFPDHWVFKGRIADIYKQIGNAVPVGLGYAAARHLIWFDSLPDDQKGKVQLVDPNAVYSRYRKTNYIYFEKLLEQQKKAERSARHE